MGDVNPSPTSEHRGPRPTLAELEPLVACALREYGLVAESSENLRYHHNATYRVLATDGARYVLRLTSGYYGPAELESEMRWLAAMQGDPGVRVPEPVVTLDGRLVCSAALSAGGEARRCTLCRWLPGHGPVEARLTRADFERLGRATAALHARSARFQPPEGFTRPTWDEHRFREWRVTDTYQKILAHVRRYFPAASVDRFAALTDQGLQQMRALGALPNGRMLVHGDFHAGNTLFDGETVAFIDFEDLGWGYSLYDIATVLFGALERPDYRELVDGFASAYAARCALPSDFAHELRLFQGLRTIFLTSLTVTSGELGESRWWEGYVVAKLERLLERA